MHATCALSVRRCTGSAWPAWPRSAALGLILGCLWPLSGCPQQDSEVAVAVRLAANEQGEIAQRAMERLVAHGQPALIHIETALHTAPPVGRRNLVVVLRRLGLAEAVPLLGHLAAADEDPGVRMESRWTLKVWMAQGGPRGRAAQAALRQADELRGTEEGG